MLGPRVFWILDFFIFWNICVVPCSVIIIAYCNLKLLGSSNPPASASWVAGTTGMCHDGQISFLFFVEMGSCPSWSQTPDLKQSSHLGLPEC
uniref:Uncharacterized protein n=1 Tax=Prolemur simus TaxID=1328070 RepID=A0A8C8ZF80_PROSS